MEECDLAKSCKFPSLTQARTKRCSLHLHTYCLPRAFGLTSSISRNPLGFPSVNPTPLLSSPHPPSLPACVKSFHPLHSIPSSRSSTLSHKLTCEGSRRRVQGRTPWLPLAVARQQANCLQWSRPYHLAGLSVALYESLSLYRKHRRRPQDKRHLRLLARAMQPR